MVIAVLAGAAAGLFSGELIAPTGISAWRLFVSLLAAPLSLVVGAQATTIDVLRVPLEVGALLFWPVWVGLMVAWKRSRSPILLVAMTMWTFQAFFQVTRRLEVLLSV